MEYHFWDMDHTIINNDCDVSWKEFLLAMGRTGADAKKLADKFYRDYENGVLDENDFLAFQLAEFVGNTPETMTMLCKSHFDKVVKKKIYPEAKMMIDLQLDEGNLVCLLTATNRYIAKPLADDLNIETVISTELQLQEGEFTGNIQGTYCYNEGKFAKLEQYCIEHDIPLTEVHYYGDSISDLAVLRRVGFPFATNPMPGLRKEAEQNSWVILDFNAR